MLTFRREITDYNTKTASALYGVDLSGYLTAVVVVFCLLALVPVVAALMKSYGGVWRLAVRNAIAPLVAVAARIGIAQNLLPFDAGLLVLLLAIVGGLLVTVMSLVDVASTGEDPNDSTAP